MNQLRISLLLSYNVKAAAWGVFLTLAVLCIPTQARAASPDAIVSGGTLSGKIIDASGAAVPNARITVTNEATRASVTVTSNASGAYQTPPLPAGSYTIKVATNGFAIQTIEHRAINQDTQVDISVAVGKEKPTKAIATAEDHTQAVAALVVSPQVVDGQQVIWQPDNQTNPKPAKSVSTQNLLSDPACGKDYVRVSVSGVLGPMGYVPAPTLASASQLTGVDTDLVLQGKGYYYPSIILYISAVPVVCLNSDSILDTQENADRQVVKIEDSAQETNIYPDWLDASFALTAEDASGQVIPNFCGDDKTVKILQLLPQQTSAGLKNQTLADTATAINSVAGALASFYPGVQAQVTGATNALNVVFQDLFPPKPIAYQYSYVSGNCQFGWFFRPNPNSTAGDKGQESILGMQQGIVLLKVARSVKTITVSGLTLSAWNKNPIKSESKNKLYLSPQKSITFRLDDPSSTNYDGISDLTLFPALIPKAQAELILHINSDKDWSAIVGKLVTFNGANDTTYVTNASLSAFLGLGSNAAKSTTATPTDNSKGNGAGGGNAANPSASANAASNVASNAAKPGSTNKSAANASKIKPKTNP